MPTGILDPRAGMIATTQAPWWHGLTATTDSEGRRIGGARILDSGGVRNGMFDARDWDASRLAEFAQAAGLSDLWNSGYSQEADWSQEGSTGVLQDRYSPELLQALSGYEFTRLGQMGDQTDRGRQLAAINRSTGQVAWGSDPYSYSKWTDAPIEGIRTLGSAYLGGQLGGMMMGAEAGAAGAAGAAAEGAGAAAAAGAAEGAGAAAAAGSAGDIALSGLLPMEAVGSTAALPALSGGTGVLAGSIGAAIPQVAPLATSGTLPMAAVGSTSALPALSGGGLLGTLQSMGGPASSVARFIGSNPQLSRLLFSAGTGLLGSIGGSSGVGSPQPLGPARQWSSPLQQGIMQTPEKTNIASPLSFKGRW